MHINICCRLFLALACFLPAAARGVEPIKYKGDGHDLQETIDNAAEASVIACDGSTIGELSMDRLGYADLLIGLGACAVPWSMSGSRRVWGDRSVRR